MSTGLPWSQLAARLCGWESSKQGVRISPLCWFLTYVAKNSLFDQAKNPWVTKSRGLGESAEAELPSICSGFLFPSHSVVTLKWAGQGQGPGVRSGAAHTFLLSTELGPWHSLLSPVPTAPRGQGKGKSSSFPAFGSGNCIKDVLLSCPTYISLHSAKNEWERLQSMSCFSVWCCVRPQASSEGKWEWGVGQRGEVRK